MQLWTLHFDGSCGPTSGGGTAAYGFALEKEGKIIEHGSGVIGTGNAMTNNLAEFVACAEGITAFIKHSPVKGFMLNVYGDSKLVINMMNRKWKPDPNKRYFPGYQLAVTALSQARKYGAIVSFDHIFREQNTICDELSKAYNG